MMLEHFDMKEEAALVRSAVEWTLTHGFVSRDIDPVNSYSTTTIGDLIRDFIENRIPSTINRNNITLSKSTII
jgi:3-isopropylmalate dehydrogenase